MLGFSVFVFSILVSAAVLAILLKSGIAQHILDAPNRLNSMHKNPTSRVGGIGIWISVFLMCVFVPVMRDSFFLLALLLCLIFISLADDRKSLSVKLRLSVQVVCTLSFLIYMATDTQLASVNQDNAIRVVLGGALLIFLVVWMTNLYNFMDGINGLAGLMGVVGFGAMGVAGVYSGNVWLACLCLSISGASIGFLAFNFPRAQLFLGDAGSIPLGFMAAALGLIGIVKSIWPIWFPLLVFSPFIVDASITLGKRILRRERIWEGHRQHYYHRLILICDWSHTKTAIAYACLMMCVSTSGLFILWHTKQLPAEEKLYSGSLAMLFLWGWVVIYALLLSFLEWRFSVEKKKNSNNNKNV